MTTLSENPTPSTPETPAIPEFKFDVSAIQVDADASNDPTVVRLISARLRKPTKAELIKREAMSLTEIVEASATEEDIVADSDRANAYLFDAIATAVKGFRTKGESAEAAKEWKEITPELLKLIPGEYKSAFIKKLYSDVTAKLVDDEEEGILLGGGDFLSVDLIVGDEDNPLYRINFQVPEPSETERRKFSNDVVRVRQPKGSRKKRNRIVTNLDAGIKFFDELMSKPGASIGGEDESLRVTVNGKTFAESQSNPVARLQFLDAIDPMYKLSVVSAAMNRYNVKVSD